MPGERTAAQLTCCFWSGRSLQVFLGCMLQSVTFEQWLLPCCVCKSIVRHSGLENRLLAGQPWQANAVLIALLCTVEQGGHAFGRACKVMVVTSSHMEPQNRLA